MFGTSTPYVWPARNKYITKIINIIDCVLMVFDSFRLYSRNRSRRSPCDFRCPPISKIVYIDYSILVHKCLSNWPIHTKIHKNKFVIEVSIAELFLFGAAFCSTFRRSLGVLQYMFGINHSIQIPKTEEISNCISSTLMTYDLSMNEVRLHPMYLAHYLEFGLIRFIS